MTFPTTTVSPSGYGYPVPYVPVVPDLPRKVLDAASSPGALEMVSWHTCDTVHCWAGWIVHLAGPQGYMLERRYGARVAAMCIAEASGHPIASDDYFFETRAEAMRRIQRWAA